MEFDINRVFTTVNADEVEVGSKGYFADTYNDLMRQIIEVTDIYELSEVLSADCQNRFKTGGLDYSLFYLVEEPKEESEEITAAEWDNRPRIMKVWDDNYSKATKGKVIYIASTDETTLPVITFVSLSGTTAGHVVCYKHCAEIAATKEVKAEKSYRPYSNTNEFIADYEKRFCPDCRGIPAIWVKSTADVLRQVVSIKEDGVILAGVNSNYWIGYSDLLDAYIYPDGAPCGIEE